MLLGWFGGFACTAWRGLGLLICYPDEYYGLVKEEGWRALMMDKRAGTEKYGESF